MFGPIPARFQIQNVGFKRPHTRQIPLKYSEVQWDVYHRWTNWNKNSANDLQFQPSLYTIVNDWIFNSSLMWLIWLSQSESRHLIYYYSLAVPVPFSHQHPSMKFQMTGNGIISRGPEVQLGFEDGSDQFQDESHASTPRKVIREIIV